MKDKCGIVGIHSKDSSIDVSSFIYYGLHALQHRGQESAGITTFNSDDMKEGTNGDHNGLNHHCGMGLLVDAFKGDIINELNGEVGIGHVRYSTTGQSKFENSQPFVNIFDDCTIAIAHNGDIINSGQLRRDLMAEGIEFISGADSEILCHLIKKEFSNNHNMIETLGNLSHIIKGSYSLVIMVNGDLYAIRDPAGMKPLALAEKDDIYMVASETVAFDVIGAKFIRDVEPGEIIYFSNNQINSHKISKAYTTENSHCMFEYVYFARPDSIIDGKNVYQVRLNIGRALYNEFQVDTDVVMPVPDSSIPAAIGYSRASGIPYGEGLIKNRYVGRTFIMPTQEERELAVKLKMNPLVSELEGKKIVLIDDSIVRGTTSESLIEVLREVGAKEIHLMIGCPPVIAPCYYGVAMASKDELIAANNSVEEIKEKLGVDSLGYINLDDLVDSIGIPATELCLGCVNEEYPTKIPSDLEAESYYKF
ncbi:Glutamine--fructose-6-phosphate aminotransferase [isomerizing] [Candidatus Methanobinarius endosymbioticus]|uniref:Amidophosphoribosyltransferase n=1 Tax=Candidatus Methanobinarius endosymbioticus TaxID=2006182 RepID=A0A366M9T7_9EURY|nr:Glutamine--fructose-6-phosphate aminotransferase [isomerizing] [Candidatus Methanobinarius endosymbioticus]